LNLRSLWKSLYYGRNILENKQFIKEFNLSESNYKARKSALKRVWWDEKNINIEALKKLRIKFKNWSFLRSNEVIIIIL